MSEVKIYFTEENNKSLYEAMNNPNYKFEIGGANLTISLDENGRPYRNWDKKFSSLKYGAFVKGKLLFVVDAEHGYLDCYLHETGTNAFYDIDEDKDIFNEAYRWSSVPIYKNEVSLDREETLENLLHMVNGNSGDFPIRSPFPEVTAEKMASASDKCWSDWM